MPQGTSDRALNGQLVGITGKADVVDVDVWLAVQTTEGDGSTLQTTSDADGCFVFELPSESLRAAKLGAVLEGVQTLDLDPKGEPLEPGQITLFVDDFVPSHLKFA